ncbi:MAG TPA: hypothetical protein VEX41_00175, partial [Candidatus Eisenbacteria bacterium]|nr:hypothetical protein [Candidatus Eisenbacteria bacterium]
MDRQRVGPNALSRTVRDEPQYGQLAGSSMVTGGATLRTDSDRAPVVGGGGAKPDRRSFSRPTAEIRSDVHGVAKDTMTSTGTPSVDSRSEI